MSVSTLLADSFFVPALSLVLSENESKEMTRIRTHSGFLERDVREHAYTHTYKITHTHAHTHTHTHTHTRTQFSLFLSF